MLLIGSILVRCILNMTISRWRNTPVPAINTLIHFYGICAHVSSNGFLGIEIKGITMNIGPPAPITGPGAPSDDSGSPSKKNADFKLMPTLTRLHWQLRHLNRYFLPCEFCIFDIGPH
jgi:hypothetical protein